MFLQKINILIAFLTFAISYVLAGGWDGYAYSGWYTVNGTKKLFFVAAKDNCNNMYVCDSATTKYIPGGKNGPIGSVGAIYDQLNGCIKHNGNNANKIYGGTADPFSKCSPVPLNINTRNDYCYNTSDTRNPKRHRTTDGPIKSYYNCVKKNNGYCLTKFGWCRYE